MKTQYFKPVDSSETAKRHQKSPNPPMSAKCPTLNSGGVVKRTFWPKSARFIKVFRDFHGGVERGLPIEAKLLGFSEVSGEKALPLLGL